MADINFNTPKVSTLDDADAMALIELLFFAYRDFVADADHLLAELDFGRAHHRVLHFVGRNPGITVAQLLDVLQITKQSLSRVLKELIDKDYVYQREGAEDRRQRLLYLSKNGDALWQKLVAPQKKRFLEACSQSGKDAAEVHTLLHGLVDPKNRTQVDTWSKRPRT
jgi:DNA-binding MarR family transcriptional regulator